MSLAQLLACVAATAAAPVPRHWPLPPVVRRPTHPPRDLQRPRCKSRFWHSLR